MLTSTLACAQQDVWNGSILSPVNHEMPDWLRLSGEYRIRAEGYEGASYTPENNQGYLLSRLHLNMDLKVSWFRVFAQMEDARPLGNDAIPKASPYKDSADLHQAFVELGNMTSGRFSVRAGRQELIFGDQRVLGSANWLNTPRTFDAVRAAVNFGKIRVDAFSASVVNPVNGVFDHHKAGDDIHGLYGTISKVLPGATIEPYIFWRLARGLVTEEGTPGRRDTKTLAIRVSRKAGNGPDYTGHFLRQYGNIGADTVSAYAFNLAAGYTLKNAPLQPRVFVDWAYASGDKNARDGRNNTFDQLYPSGHGLYGIVDLFGWRNLSDVKTGVEIKPWKKTQLSAVTNSLYLANAHDGLYNGAGNLVVRKADGSAGTHIGQELEGTGSYAFTRFLSAGAGYGHLFPGHFIKSATKGSSYNISYLMITYAF
jgi:hypothetical protein